LLFNIAEYNLALLIMINTVLTDLALKCTPCKPDMKDHPCSILDSYLTPEKTGSFNKILQHEMKETTLNRDIKSLHTGKEKAICPTEYHPLIVQFSAWVTQLQSFQVPHSMITHGH